jgi:predicted RND superfamily exporter protein
MVDFLKEVFPEDGPVHVTARVTGSTLIAARALSFLVEDMFNSLGTAFLVISLFMMFMLRSFRVGLISMIPNVAPLLVTVGFMGWTGIPIRTSTALIFSISVGVAANDTIHFAVRYREELLATRDRRLAIRNTLLSTGRAIIFTSILLVVGFVTMLTTRFVGIFQMGLLGAVTLTTALGVVLLLFPISLDFFKPWSRYVEKRPPEER